MADTSDLNLNIGSRIRAHRLKHNIKISDLADMTGLTSSTISQVERALISPSIATLKKICNAMNIPIGLLFDDGQDLPQEELKNDNKLVYESIVELASTLKMRLSVDFKDISPVVHRENRKFLSPGTGLRYYLLNPNLSGPLEMIYNEYDPGVSTGPALYTHPGVECGLVLTGELLVQIKNKSYTLKEGDSITFNSSDPHFMKNVSDIVCTCIWVNTPPWF
jgi:transcriptional regulator with XRE-family HTH domain